METVFRVRLIEELEERRHVLDVKCGDRSYDGHAQHVMGVRFTFDDSHVLSTGGGDRCIFQWTCEYEEQDEQHDNDQHDRRHHGHDRNFGANKEGHCKVLLAETTDRKRKPIIAKISTDPNSAKKLLHEYQLLEHIHTTLGDTGSDFIIDLIDWVENYSLHRCEKVLVSLKIVVQLFTTV